jgi:prepilin-type N-terminal cleavage/methylation domain-containing protein
MKKGMTIVELSIVLVVIGILFGLAIKSRSLIELANIRKETRKLTRFELAMSTVMQRLGPTGRVTELPVKPGSGGAILEEAQFLENAFLADSDYLTYGTPSTVRKRIINRRLSNLESSPGATLEIEAMPYLFCFIETTMDDAKADTGQGIFSDNVSFEGVDANGNSKRYGRIDLVNGELPFNCMESWPKGYAGKTSGSPNYAQYYWFLF